MTWIPGLSRLRAAGRVLTGVARLEQEVERTRLALGRAEARRVRSETYDNLQDAEFEVFSQWGEDGIIQYLLGKVPVRNDVFIEFGVEDYSESNTRFLLQNDNWRGVILDAGDAHARFLHERGLDWRHDIQALTAFITKENIDHVIADAGLAGDIGLLSVDIDGNDYWVLEGIRQVSPRILIVEYNSIFGPDASITVPYDAGFVRTRAHHSNLYYGASLQALVALAETKGYTLVGSNKAGSNAFFVRNDVLGPLRPSSARGTWVRSRFREGRGEGGRLTLQDSHRGGLASIRDLPVFDTRSGRIVPIAEVVAMPPVCP